MKSIVIRVIGEVPSLNLEHVVDEDLKVDLQSATRERKGGAILSELLLRLLYGLRIQVDMRR